MAKTPAQVRADSRKRNKKWRKENPERQKARCRQFHKENPVYNLSKRAEEKGLEFDLTVEWYWKIVDGGLCQKTGLPFVLTENQNDPFQPSVDRIDSSLGYTKDNCQVTCLIFNFCKNQFTDQDVYKFAKAFVAKYDNDNNFIGNGTRSRRLLYKNWQDDGKIRWDEISIDDPCPN